MKSRNSRVRELCVRILARLDRLRTLSAGEIEALPPDQSEEERIDGQVVVLTTYRDALPSGESLLVVQGFLPSWRFPTYIGPAGIGHMFAEGIVARSSGQIHDAEEELLWQFR